MTKNPKDKQAQLLEMMGKTIAAPTEKEPARGRTERASIMLYPEDKALIRQLTAFLASQGLPANASLIIRTALNAVKQGEEFLTAYEKVRGLDLRSKEARKKRQPT